MNERILVIGAEPHLPCEAVMTLRDHGYEVLEAPDAAEGLRLAKIHQPALILLDVTLSDADGTEVCRRIKSDPELADVLVLLGSDLRISSEEQAAGLEALADGYIAWPISGRELLARVESLLRAWRAERRARYLNRVLRAIRNVNQLIARETDPQRLLNGACQALVAGGGYTTAWAVLLGTGERVVFAEQAGLDEMPSAVREALDQGEKVPCLEQALEAKNGLAVFRAERALCAHCPLLPFHDSHAVSAVRLEHSGQCFGVLAVSFPPDTPVGEEDRALVQEVADDLGFALYALALERERQQAVAQLRESEERFQRLAENAADLIYRYEFYPRRGFTYVNPAATLITGYTPEEHYADPDLGLKIVHPDDRSLLEEYFAGSGRFYEPLVLRWIRKDGAIVWTEQRNVPIYDEQGNLVAIEGIARDVTVRKQAEETLRAEWAQMRALFDSIDQAIYLTDPYTYEILFVNRYLCRLLGKDPSGGLCYREFQGLDEPCPFCTNAVILARKGEPYVWEYHNPLLERDYLITDKIITDPHGRDIRFEIAIDITERKRVERALRESEERHRIIAQLISDYGYALSVLPDGTLRWEWLTESFTRVFGLAAADLEASEQWERIIHPEDQPRVKAHWEKLLAGHEDRCELRLIMSTGAVRWVRNYAYPVRDAEGHVVRIVGAARDITERRRAEEESRRRQHELETLNRVGRALAETLELPRIYRIAHAHVAELVDCPVFGISLYDAEKRLLRAEYMVSDGEVLDVALFPPLDMSGEPTGGRLRAIVSRRPEVVRDLNATAQAAKVVYRIGRPGDDRVAQSAVYVPMVVQDQVIGLLEAQSYQREAYSEDQVALLVPIANQIGLAIANARLYEETRRRALHQEALSSIIAAVIRPTDLPSLLRAILKDTLEATGVAYGCIWSGDEVISIGLPEGCATQMRREHAGFTLVGPIAVADWQAMDGLDPKLAASMRALGVRASLTVPILAEGRYVGGLSLVSPVPRAWTEDEIALAVAVGAQVGTAIERQQLLTQVEAQARQVQQIVDTIPEGVLVVDRNGRVELANPTAVRDLAVLAEAKVGDVLTRLGDRPLAEVLTSPPRGGWHEVHAAGRIFAVTARPINSVPQPERYLLVINDVTRERVLRAQQEQQERLAVVGQLAAGIAHDFNNIMAVIILYAQMALGSRDLPPRERERLETIAEQAKRATDLIKQVLDFGRRAPHEPKPMDLVPFLKEQAKLLERTIPENIRISFRYRVEECIVNADPVRIQQVITNLALNARDAMPAGGELRIGLELLHVARPQEAPVAEMKAGDWAMITLTDTGIGIPPEVLPHIFEPFFTTKEPGKGSGLGLAQVWGIVKQHEGFIDVRTQVGQGTTFIVYLPALTRLHSSAPQITSVALAQGRGETILVVEDNVPLRKALVETLKLLNYRPLEAANGEEALALLEEPGNVVDLVLSDLVMPKMGGEALFRALRHRGMRMPVVMLSGHPLETELRELERQGLAGWVMKPPQPEQLAELLARVLQTSRNASGE